MTTDGIRAIDWTPARVRAVDDYMAGRISVAEAASRANLSAKQINARVGVLKKRRHHPTAADRAAAARAVLP